MGSPTGPIQEIYVDFRFGAHRYRKRPFLSCVRQIHAWSKIEHREFDLFIEYGEGNQWFAHHVANLLTSKEAPTYNDWIRPRTSLYYAKMWYRRNNEKRAIKALNDAVRQFNYCHKKWVSYLNGVTSGAGRAITIIVITNLVLSSAVGGLLTVGGKTLLQGALAAGGITLLQESLIAGGKKYQGLKPDIGGVLASTAGSIVGSWLGGKLLAPFLLKLKARAVSRFMGKKVTSAAVEAEIKALMGRGILPAINQTTNEYIFTFSMGIGTEALKGYVLEYLMKGGSEKLTEEQVMDKVIERIPDSKIDAFNKQLGWVSKPK